MKIFSGVTSRSIQWFKDFKLLELKHLGAKLFPFVLWSYITATAYLQLSSKTIEYCW